MNTKLKAGNTVKIENAYFKTDNELLFITHCPEDVGWIRKKFLFFKFCKIRKKVKNLTFHLDHFALL